MKRAGKLLWTVLLCGALCACGTQQKAPVEEQAPTAETPEELVVDAPAAYTPAETVAFSAAAAEITDARRAALEQPTELAGFSDYLVEETEALVSAQEIKTLRSGSGEKPETISHDQAAADADLLARALKAGYGAYYFFGEAAFEQAEAETLAWLEGQTTVSVSEFDGILQTNYSFMRDAHAAVAPVQADIDGVRREDCWSYFYCAQAEQVWERDENGYFKTADGEKWYYDGCEQDAVSIRLTLSKGGQLVYAPVQFCPAAEMEETSRIRLRCGDRVAWEEVTWTAGEPYPNGGGGYFQQDVDYRLEQNGGITYISLRNTDQKTFRKEFQQFAKSGTAARESSAVILDLRANAGGASGDYIRQWFQNFLGAEPEARQATAMRASALNGLSDGGSVFQNVSVTEGKLIENDIPIFVLVDENTASGGESFLQELRTVENTVVVGSNSKGCSLCGHGGEEMTFHLPNSQIYFGFGGVIGFYNTLENVDDIGYEPDVWCDPQDALSRVFRLIAAEDLAEESATEALAGELYQITLRWHAELLRAYIGRDYEDIPPERRFGTEEGTYTIEVKVNGQRVTGFEILENEHPEVCEFTVDPEGDLQVRVLGPGETKFTIGYQGSRASFTWNAGVGPVKSGPDTITLRWYTDIFTGSVKAVDLVPGEGYGDPTPGPQDLVVLLNGEETTDFTITSSNEASAAVSVTPEGRILLESGVNDSWLTVTCGESMARFHWWGQID